jgi:hypothetical protein
VRQPAYRTFTFKEILWFTYLGNRTVPRIVGAALFTSVILLMSGCAEVYGHEEFTKMIMNKSEDEVTTAIGKPERVDAGNPAHVVWTYYGRTYDIENKNIRDAKEQVIFEPSAATHKLEVVDIKYERG